MHNISLVYIWALLSIFSLLYISSQAYNASSRDGIDLKDDRNLMDTSMQDSTPYNPDIQHLNVETFLQHHTTRLIEQHDENGVHNTAYSNIIWRNLYDSGKFYAIPEEIRIHIETSDQLKQTRQASEEKGDREDLSILLPQQTSHPTPAYSDWRETGLLQNVIPTFACVGGHASTVLSSLARDGQALSGIPASGIRGPSIKESAVCTFPYFRWQYNVIRSNSCAEGLLTDAIEYSLFHGGLCAEVWYPSTHYSIDDVGIDGCDFQAVYDCSAVSRVAHRWLKIRSYAPNINVYKNLLAATPIVINMHNPSDIIQWMFYGGGLIDDDDCPGDQEGEYKNNTAELVGFKPATHPSNIFGQDYWILKSSLGPSWGYNGYFYMTDSSALNGGTCGMYRDEATPFYVQYSRVAWPLGLY